MGEIDIVGIDLAKHVFQLRGAAAYGRVLFRRRLRREKLLAFLSSQPACDVVMEASEKRFLEPFSRATQILRLRRKMLQSAIGPARLATPIHPLRRQKPL